MSLIFKLVSKFAVEESDKTRFLSYPRETPYMLIDCSFEEDESSNEEENIYASYSLFNPRSGETIKITDKKVPKVLFGGSVLLGTSRGWALFMRLDDYTIHLSNVLNPWSLESSQTTIALPPFTDNLHLHWDMVTNVSLSTSFPDLDNDYIVSVVFFGSKLSYCMPNRDSEWTNIKIPFSTDSDSHVFYSWKDQMFNLLTSGCAYMATFDLKNNNKNPSFLRLQFENFPLIPQHEWEIVSSCLRIDYMVESSCGKRFIVQWYVEPRGLWSTIARINEKTKRFMVFKVEDMGKDEGRGIIANYTENIGDLCIFIGENETFCLEASKFPGLKPNSIYYVSYGFGVYNISNRSSHEYSLKDFPSSRGFAFFLSPLLH